MEIVYRVGRGHDNYRGRAGALVVAVAIGTGAVIFFLFRKVRRRSTILKAGTSGELVVHRGPKVPQPPEKGFPEATPYECLAALVGCEKCHGALGAPERYSERWLREATAKFGAKGHQAFQEWADFLKTGLNGGRHAEWAVMDIPPNKTFALHAHPVLEVVHVLAGALHETRMAGPPLPLDGVDEVDLSQMEPEFYHSCCESGEFMVNERGSVHQSYTKSEGAIILSLWGGSHLNVGQKQLPKGFVPYQTSVEA